MEVKGFRLVFGFVVEMLNVTGFFCLFNFKNRERLWIRRFFLGTEVGGGYG